MNEMNEIEPPSWPRPSSPDDHELEINLRRIARAGGPGADFVVIGDLDSIGAPVLAQAWAAGVVTLPPHVHLDLGRVGFCNAAGTRTVQEILASSRRHGLAVTMSMQAHLDWLLRLVGVDLGGLAQLDVVPHSTERLP